MHSWSILSFFEPDTLMKLFETARFNSLGVGACPLPPPSLNPDQWPSGQEMPVSAWTSPALHTEYIYANGIGVKLIALYARRPYTVKYIGEFGI